MPMDANAVLAIGDKIRALRLAKTWTQEILAENAKIQLNTLQNLETGKSKPQLQTLQKIARAFQLEADELLSFVPLPHLTLPFRQGTSRDRDVIIGDAARPLLAGSAQQRLDDASPPTEAWGDDEIKRRQFLKSLGSAATSLALPGSLGVLSEAPAEPQPIALGTGMWTSNEANALALLLDDKVATTPEVITRAIHEWLVTPPPQMVELATGRRISEPLVAQVEKRFVQLQHIDDVAGGRDLLPIVERELAASVQLLRDAAYTDKLGRRLLATIAGLSKLASWVAADAGIDAKVTRYTGVGLKAAHASDDRALAASLISRFAYLRTIKGHINDGILYARTAIHGGDKWVSATAHALLHQGAAWAHACAGQLHQAELALTASERDFSRSNPDNDPEWIYWFGAEMIEAGAGRCYVRLNQPKRAMHRLLAALELCDPRWIRERAFHVSWLCEAHIADRNMEEAAHYAMLTADFASRTTSTRMDARVIELSEKLRPFSQTAAVKDFLENARELGFG